MRFPIQLLLALCLIAGLQSCQREVDYAVPPTPTNGGSGGNNGGGGGGNNGGTTADSSYLPLATGNWWKFKDSTSGNFQTQTVSSRTIPFNGRNFTAIALSPAASGVDTTYYTHDATDYRFLALVAMPNIRLEYLYLRDTVMGATWSTNAGSVNGFPATTQGTVLETNISKNILGTTFQKVIHSYLEVTYGGIGIVARYHFYSAKGVGVIAIYSDLGMPGGPQSRVAQELEDYHLN
ncbi:MAG: hypothetical protein EOO08_06035 [Chitinophagaceae bacterium]|nr:MAG: hypothetical protein EOO08_06035 [Chitinophagaceae bacterium]